MEPRGRVEFKTVVDEYHQTIKDKPNGAIFFAVCRGKVWTPQVFYVQLIDSFTEYLIRSYRLAKELTFLMIKAELLSLQDCLFHRRKTQKLF